MKKQIKQVLKSMYYSKTGKILRKYPERIIYYVRSFKNHNYIQERTKKHIKNEQFRVVFLLQYPEVWNSVKTVYESCLANNIETYIVACPQYNGSMDNPAFKFATKYCINVINAYDTETKEWFDLKELNPTYLFYTRPYDKEYPTQYKPKETAKYTKLCYIPYGYEFVTGHHVEVEYNLKTFPYTSMVFCDGKTTQEYCEKLKGSMKYPIIYNIGYPRFDLIYRKMSENKEEYSDAERVVLWTPRWSLDEKNNDGTSYFKLIDKLLEYFNNPINKNKKLIIRPHPLMFSNFVKLGKMTLEEVDNIKKRIEISLNIEFDRNEDYLQTALISDVIISDYSSMLIEFLMLGKPIIYCGNSDSFDQVGKLMNNAMYNISPNISVIQRMELLLEGKDSLDEERRNIQQVLSNGFDGNIGSRIVNKIIEDLETGDKI